MSRAAASLCVFSSRNLSIFYVSVVAGPVRFLTPVEDGHRPKMLSVFVRGTQEAMAEVSPCDEPAQASGACAFGIDALPIELVHLIVSHLPLPEPRPAAQPHHPATATPPDVRP